MGKSVWRAVLPSLLIFLASCGGGSGGGGGSVGLQSTASQASSTDAAGALAKSSKADSQDQTADPVISAAQTDALGGVAALGAQGADLQAAFIRTLRGADPLPYATLDTSGLGSPRTMVYDAVHGDIYASYPSGYYSTGLSAIKRFRPNATATAWASATLSIPGLRDIALATDASVLAAVDSSKTVHLIDPATFRIKSSHSASFDIGDSGRNTEVSIVFTKDGKLWMPTGDGGWNGLGSFDLRTLAFEDVMPYCCYGGPFLAASRDGARLMVAPSGSISPAPPLLYMDANDGVFKTNPIGLTFFYYDTSLSDNGNRFLMNSYAVYDRQFGMVGNLPLLPNGNRAAQLSADGRRAYVLDYSVEPGTDALPVVWVYDTSASAGTQLQLSAVGKFTLGDVPGCRNSDYPFNCYHPKMRVTPDSKNLLLLGEQKLIVAPIPEALREPTPKPAS